MHAADSLCGKRFPVSAALLSSILLGCGQTAPESTPFES